MKRTQYGWVFLIVIFVLGGVILFQENNFQTLLIVGGVFLLLLLLFFKLTIVVDEKYIRFSMGIGVIRGKYKLRDISLCKPLSYIPFGWGIRFRPGVTLFNVSGNKAIELQLKNKNRSIWLGTNCPNEIADYVNKKRAGE